MRFERPTIEGQIHAALNSSPPRIPVLVGTCGSGRTTLLLRLKERIGGQATRYIDLERIASTPECLLQTVMSLTDGGDHEPNGASTTARDAFVAALGFMDAARTKDGVVMTFLLDEVLELRTFESFPGLRTVFRDLFSALSTSGNRFVLTSRYVHRARRLLRDVPGPFEVIPLTPLSVAEIAAGLESAAVRVPVAARDELAIAIHALTDGRPIYVRALVETMSRGEGRGADDPVSALAAQMAPDGELATICRFRYELRLHRARGYGALKAILAILAEQESLTLTQIAQKLRRTPGSTKDYLSWLEDIDLVSVRQKRYTFTDPVLRLWVRLHCRPSAPTEDDLAREVHRYALARLPYQEAALAMAVGEPKRWGIIEID